jgi:hypothetical protein
MSGNSTTIKEFNQTTNSRDSLAEIAKKNAGTLTTDDQQKLAGVRNVVSQLNDQLDGGKARIEVAEKALGRSLSPDEQKWVLSAHNKHSDVGYAGKSAGYDQDWEISKLRDKLKDRPASMSKEETRVLMKFGILGAEPQSISLRGDGLSPSAIVAKIKALGQKSLEGAAQIAEKNAGNKLTAESILYREEAIARLQEKLSNAKNNGSVGRETAELEAHASILGSQTRDPKAQQRMKDLIIYAFQKKLPELIKGNTIFYGSLGKNEADVLAEYIRILRKLEPAKNDLGKQKELFQLKVLEEYHASLRNGPSKSRQVPIISPYKEATTQNLK